jgi:hypothetical protein
MRLIFQLNLQAKAPPVPVVQTTPLVGGPGGPIVDILNLEEIACLRKRRPDPLAPKKSTCRQLLAGVVIPIRPPSLVTYENENELMVAGEPRTPLERHLDAVYAPPSGTAVGIFVGLALGLGVAFAMQKGKK